MGSRPLLAALLGAAVVALAAAPAVAGEQKEVETVGDWKVLQDTDAGGAISCLIARGYKEEGDDKATTVVFGRENGQIVTALGWGGWSFEPKRTRTLVLLIGGRIVDLRSTWTADGTQLVSSLPASYEGQLLAADRIVLRLKDSDPSFRLDGLPAAWEGMKRCETPPEPSQARITAYMAGLFLQKAFDTCDVPTTARQRTDLSAKLAALKPEMRGVEAEVQQVLAQQFDKTGCPKEGDTAAFKQKVATYLSLSPDAFAAELDRQEAEKTAKAAADKAAADKAAADKVVADRKAAEAASERAAADRKAAEAAAEKAAADRKAAEAASDKAAADKASAQAAVAERAAADRKAAEAAAEKAAADRKAAEAAAEKAAAEARTAADTKPVDPKSADAAPGDKDAPGTVKPDAAPGAQRP